MIDELKFTLTIVRRPNKLSKDGWLYTALEIDHCYSGSSKHALNKLKAIVRSYFEAVMESKGPVEVFCPAPRAYWNDEIVAHYWVVVYRSMLGDIHCSFYRLGDG